MKLIKHILKQTVTYKIGKEVWANIVEFIEVLGNITTCGFEFFKAILKGELDKKELIAQCERFGISSLPITLSIVGMTSIIIVSQVAQEMVKQGGGNFVGALVAILIVRFCHYLYDWLINGFRTSNNEGYRANRRTSHFKGKPFWLSICA